MLIAVMTALQIVRPSQRKYFPNKRTQVSLKTCLTKELLDTEIEFNHLSTNPRVNVFVQQWAPSL